MEHNDLNSVLKDSVKQKENIILLEGSDQAAILGHALVLSTNCSQEYPKTNEDILCEQLEDGKNDSFLSKFVHDNTALLHYSDNTVGHYVDFDLSSLVEEIIKSTPSTKINEIETLYGVNECQVRVTVENIESEALAGHPHYINIKQTRGESKPVKTWECGICKKEFQHHYTLMRHLPTHTDVRKYVCKICNKAFRQMSTLSQHKAIHTNVRPHICEVCSKAFNRISTLISHRRTHSEMKPHKCPVCGKGFHQKGNMRNHVFTHTNERPYKCDVCFKGFNQKSNLMCHKLNVHADNKGKYDCNTCGVVFDQKVHFKEHKAKLHPGSKSSDSFTNGALQPDKEEWLKDNKENLNFDEQFNKCLTQNLKEKIDKENSETDWNQVSLVTSNDYNDIHLCNRNNLMLNASEIIEGVIEKNEFYFNPVDGVPVPLLAVVKKTEQFT